MKKLLLFLGTVFIVICLNVWLVFLYDAKHDLNLIKYKETSQTVGMLVYKGVVYQQCLKQGVSLDFTHMDSVYVKEIRSRQ